MDSIIPNIVSKVAQCCPFNKMEFASLFFKTHKKFEYLGLNILNLAVDVNKSWNPTLNLDASNL